jgi:spore maturation protein CgeB
MLRAGYSPSVRLFEAAACGVPILTDEWAGLNTFFTPSLEILPVRNVRDVTSYLQMAPEQRIAVGERARRRTLRLHTAAVRAEELEQYVLLALERVSCSRQRSRAAVRPSPTAAVI